MECILTGERNEYRYKTFANMFTPFYANDNRIKILEEFLKKIKSLQ